MSPISRPSAAYYDDNYGYGPAGSNRPCVVPRRYPRGLFGGTATDTTIDGFRARGK